MKQVKTQSSGWLECLVSRLGLVGIALRAGRSIGRAGAHYQEIDRESWKKAMDAELEESWAREARLEEELAYVKLQRDALLKITWLDLPGDPDESTAAWQEQFNKGWVRRGELGQMKGTS